MVIKQHEIQLPDCVMTGKIHNNRPLCEQFIHIADNIHANHHTNTCPDKQIENNLHFLWIDTKINKMYVDNIRNTARLNPELQTNLWIDEHNSGLTIPGVNVMRCDDLSFSNKELYRQLASENSPHRVGKRADILRYAIIYHMGGIYMDADCESIKPLPIETKTSFVVHCLNQPKQCKHAYMHNNHVFGFYKGCPFMRFVNDLVPHSYDKFDHFFTQVGPRFFCRCVYYNNPDIYSLSNNYTNNSFTHMLHGNWNEERNKQ